MTPGSATSSTIYQNESMHDQYHVHSTAVVGASCVPINPIPTWHRTQKKQEFRETTHRIIRCFPLAFTWEAVAMIRFKARVVVGDQCGREILVIGVTSQPSLVGLPRMHSTDTPLSSLQSCIDWRRQILESIGAPLREVSS